ncbi:MAG TPA: EAL domain-containing protein [Tepidisphaeraceae bacterium]|jgi:diguanylate cyclase (GGDEF)-like protein/PAS domain S-box-containing protein|nr:EAL domain-containing protein [Tepidisphaeraceae bacterium]
MVQQKLLIVDDSPDIHELVQAWLVTEPLQFFSCLDGERAADTARAVRPDLILLDVDLPGLNGFQICAKLKADPITVDIPIVFLTGASSTEEKLRGLELGAADYVIKPFDPAELRARVRSSLQSKGLMDLLAQKALTLQESEERFRVLAENSSDAISRHDPNGIYLYASPASRAILGYAPDQLQGRALAEFVHPEDRPALDACYRTSRASGETGTIEFRFLRSDGQYVWLESTCRTLADARDGSVREIHASARDVTVRKQMEHREQTRAEVLEMIAQGQPLNEILRRLIEAAEHQEPQAVAAGVMLCGGFLHHCAPHLPTPLASSIERQLYSLLNRFAALSTERNERIIVCDLTTDPAWESLRQTVAEHGLKCCWAILIHSRHKESSGAFALYWRENHRPDASAIELMKLASDLTGVAVEHRQLTDQLTFQAHHDAMTQLPNREFFADHLQQALAVSRRNNRPAAALLVDVDRFKYINDTYGHQAGDEMLCQVAHRLRRRLRGCDLLARMGGDEFAAILTDLTHPEDAHAVAMALMDEFKQPIDFQGRKQFVTISIGSAVFPRDASDSTSLLKNADLALYRAKDDGRNVARPYTADMGEGTVERMELEGALRQAVENQELKLHFQPKVDRAGRIKGLEVLLRWHHPTLGMVPPAKFIPLAEDTGVIIPIGTWVLQEAARQTRAWLSAGLPLTPLSVNVSTVQFAQPDFIRTVGNALETSGVPERWLEIELTETLLMRNIRDAGDKLSQLREMKVAVAVDDFGTGYSSLAYLQRLSLETLKIADTFVNTIDTGRNGGSGRAIIGAIVALAQSLGLKVVAEGVETDAQCDFLTKIGCDFLQGYLFSPPRPADQIEPMLRRQLDTAASLLARSA